jgi:5-methylcytosine-specific restriction protein A
MRRARSCLDCGRSHRNVSRCDDCLRANRGVYGVEWQALSVRMRAEHVEAYGLWCPGWEVPAHSVPTAASFVLDHDIGVCCRSCNSRKAATYDKEQPVRGSQRPMPQFR